MYVYRKREVLLEEEVVEKKVEKNTL
jgi:hypothetical protein